MRSEYEKRTFKIVERREFWEKEAGKDCPIIHLKAFFKILNTLYVCILCMKRREKVLWLF